MSQRKARAVKKLVCGQSGGGSVSITSTKCGVSGCFYTNNDIDTFLKNLSGLEDDDMQSASMFTPQGLIVSSMNIRTVMQELDRLRESGVGVRVEGVSALNNPSTPINKLPIIRPLHCAFRSFGQAIQVFTTYRPVMLLGKFQCYMLLLHLKKSVEYTFKQTKMQVALISISFHQPCSGSMFEEIFVHRTLKTPREITSLFFQIRQAIMKIHSAGFFHGDLKLENTVVCRKGSKTIAKVIDLPEHNYKGTFALGKGKYGFVHTFTFASQPSRFSTKKTSDIVDGMMYDKIVFNMLVAFVLSRFNTTNINPLIEDFKKLHFPEATKYIITNKITGTDLKESPPSEYRVNGINWIRKIKTYFSQDGSQEESLPVGKPMQGPLSSTTPYAL